jgi:lipid-binding SYLF domain-containing protein
MVAAAKDMSVPLRRRHLLPLAALPLLPLPAHAVTRREIDEAVEPALRRLREGEQTRVLAENARAVLVFPRIIRAGFAIGGQYGNGALHAGGAPQARVERRAAPLPPPQPAGTPLAPPVPVPPATRVEVPAPAPWSHLGYYNIAGASFGLQIGAQAYGLAMFFMTDAALDFFRRTEGWEIGTGPSVVALDAGMAGSLTSSTMSQAVYSVTFGQQGLMATLSLEGTKITRIRPG